MVTLTDLQRLELERFHDVFGCFEIICRKVSLWLYHILPGPFLSNANSTDNIHYNYADAQILHQFMNIFSVDRLR